MLVKSCRERTVADAIELDCRSCLKLQLPCDRRDLPPKPISSRWQGKALGLERQQGPPKHALSCGLRLPDDWSSSTDFRRPVQLPQRWKGRKTQAGDSITNFPGGEREETKVKEDRGKARLDTTRPGPPASSLLPKWKRFKEWEGTDVVPSSRLKLPFWQTGVEVERDESVVGELEAARCCMCCRIALMTLD